MILPAVFLTKFSNLLFVYLVGSEIDLVMYLDLLSYLKYFIKRNPE